MKLLYLVLATGASCISPSDVDCNELFEGI
jgi:hypothetical protein